MNRIFIALAALIALQAQAQPLAGGAVRQGQLNPGESQRWPVQVENGNVAQGNFNSDGAELDLVDAQGHHLRRLVSLNNSPQSFMWTMQAGQQLEVKSGLNGATYELSLTKTYLPVAQKAPLPIARPLESPRLQALSDTLTAGGSTDSFWQELAIQGSPLVEPLSSTHSLVTFVWRGKQDTHGVRLFGGPSSDHDPLQRMGQSDVWWISFKVPVSARFSYRLAPNVPQVQGSAFDNRRMILATAQRDPLNPHVFPLQVDKTLDVFQGFSVVELPKAPPQPWSKPRAEVEQVQPERHKVKSALLGNERDVWLYRPASVKPQALLVLFDAHAYREDAPAPQIVANLMADGLIPPTAVLLVANPTPEARAAELPPNPLFARFLDEELMPWVRTQGVAFPPDHTVVAGSSYGGLASAYLGYQLPQWFGNVLSLSGSYWWAPPNEQPGWMQRAYEQAEPKPLRFYIDAGHYESTRGGRDGILETSRQLADVLRSKGYDVTQRESATGHDYFHWQGALACGLVALLNPEQFSKGLEACNQAQQ